MLNIRIDELGFSEETLNKLKQNNILSLNQLEKFTDDDFINLRFNRIIVNEIIDKMSFLGYIFVEDKKTHHFNFELKTYEYIDEIKGRCK